MHPLHHLSRLLLGLGRGLAECLIVAVSVVLSLLLTTTALIVLVGDTELWLSSFAIATAVPLMVATPVSIGLMGLLRELDEAHEETRRLARTDPLTGLFNRRYWIEVAERELARSAFDGTSTTVLMVDVDNFKAINDTHGHCVGDHVLMAVAGTCRDTLRPTDLIARWGGEEFLILLTLTDAGEGMEIAERLRQQVADAAMAGTFAPAADVTVSIGVADTGPTAAGYDLHRLLALVDQALHAAKDAGRDRVRRSTLPEGRRASPLELAAETVS